MVFNSFTFLIFFGIFYLLYWFVFKKHLKQQNLLLLAGSFFFYAWWDYRFLSLLVGSTALTFGLGKAIGKSSSDKLKKLYLTIGVLQGLGAIFLFKYFNFFIHSFVGLLHRFNIESNLHTLNLILPLGISFYTFRTLSYLLDIKKHRIEPTSDWIVFFNYVCFFPSLMSGPIDRARDLTPQLEKPRTFNYDRTTDGLKQILWGLFKKIVIADNCASFVNHTFDNFDVLPGSSLVIGAVVYSIQLYADFSGYSDMAIGFSSLLGFKITKNFAFPFFAQNIAQFWQRWHISLTSWLTEYVFTPLSIALRNWGKLGLILAIVINFTLCGIWHGANWTYVVFGFIHGCFFIPLILNGTINKKKKFTGKFLPSFREFFNICKTFGLVLIGFVIFRANTIQDAYGYFRGILSKSTFSLPSVEPSIIILVIVFMTVEWWGKDREYAIENMGNKWPRNGRWLAYYALTLLIIFTLIYSDPSEENFIYFKF